MKLIVGSVALMLVVSPAWAGKPPSSGQLQAPKAIEKELRRLAGSSATNCGVVAGMADLSSGRSCVQKSYAQSTAFTFAVGPEVGASGMWFAWAGTRRGRVYQLLAFNESTGNQRIMITECLAFEITEESGIHCSIGPS